MKTMLEIFAERKPDELQIIKTRQRGSNTHITLRFGEIETTTTLPTACAPGNENKVVDFTINATMMHVYLELGQYEKVKAWMEKQNQITKLN